MLAIMEDQRKIFIAGLKKFIMLDKVILAKDLAKAIPRSTATVSGWFSGRSLISYKDMEAVIEILEKKKVTYEMIMEVGRDIIAPTKKESAEQLIRKLAELTGEPIPLRLNEEHHNIIDEFENQELAKDVNHKLLELEKLTGTNGLMEVLGFIEYQITKSSNQGNKKPLENSQTLGDGTGGK